MMGWWMLPEAATTFLIHKREVMKHFSSKWMALLEALHPISHAERVPTI